MDELLFLGALMLGTDLLDDDKVEPPKDDVFEELNDATSKSIDPLKVLAAHMIYENLDL